MPLHITARDDYILVEPEIGMDYWEIIDGLLKIFSMPEFEDRGDIWVFRDGPMQMLYTDIYKIHDVAVKFYPSVSRDRKTAIVTETGIQRSLATLYSKIGKNLKRQIRVFSDLKSAEKWIVA